MAKIEVLTGLTIQQAMACAVLGRKVRYHDWPEGKYMDYDGGSYRVLIGEDDCFDDINEVDALDFFAKHYTPEYIGAAWGVVV